MYRTTKYVSGAVAPKRGYEEYRPNLKVHKNEYKRQTKKLSIGWVVAVSFIALLLGLVLYRYNYIVELNFKVAEAKSKYYAMVDDNTQMRVFIEKNLDLSKIKSKATNDLKMQKPGQNQKIAVSVPVKDFSVASSDASVNGGGDFFSFIAEKLKAIVGG